MKFSTRMGHMLRELFPNVLVLKILGDQLDRPRSLLKRFLRNFSRISVVYVPFLMYNFSLPIYIFVFVEAY